MSKFYHTMRSGIYRYCIPINVSYINSLRTNAYAPLNVSTTIGCFVTWTVLFNVTYYNALCCGASWDLMNSAMGSTYKILPKPWMQWLSYKIARGTLMTSDICHRNVRSHVVAFKCIDDTNTYTYVNIHFKYMCAYDLSKYI